MIQFLKYRTLSAIFSLLLVTAFLVNAWHNYNTRGHVFSYSIDFLGGTQILLKFDKVITRADVQAALEQKGWQHFEVREFANNELLIRVKEFAHDAKGLGERLAQDVRVSMPENTVTILQSEGVGPGVGQELRNKSMRAIVIALIAMLAYIAFRFWSFAFAIGAVVALFHDAFVMIAMFMFFNREISVNVIAAILLVMGYSINDTIVIFSQIRENMKKMRDKGLPLAQIVNLSLNQTLKRTLLTSISTALPVLAMLIIGGEALFDLSFAFLIGIIFGTYSSIYIASPVMMLVSRREDN